MAAGLTLIFGVMDIINIAQGALIVLGAYMSYVLSVHLGIDLFAGLHHHDPGVLRARRVHRVGVHAPAARPGADRDVDSRHLRRGDHHRGDAQCHLRRRLPPAAALVCEQHVPSYSGSICRTYTCSASCSRSCCWASSTTSCTGPIRTWRPRVTAEPPAAELIGINVNRVRAVSVGIGVSVTAAAGWCSARPTRSTRAVDTT